ncbi:recombinase family protein [Massilia sp. SR12]
MIGDVRVSTDDPHLDLQRDALTTAGCERIFEDTVSGAKSERTGLAALMNVLRAGDTVVIWLSTMLRQIKCIIDEACLVSAPDDQMALGPPFPFSAWLRTGKRCVRQFANLRCLR